MTEPTLDRNQTWAQYIADRQKLRDQIELCLPSALLHERKGPGGLEEQLSVICTEISMAIALSGITFNRGDDFDGEVW